MCAVEQTGAVSLSAMVMFWVVGLPSVMPADGLLIVRMAVSVPSTSASSTTVNVTEPVVCAVRES